MCLTARPPLGFHHTLTDTSNVQEQKKKNKTGSDSKFYSQSRQATLLLSWAFSWWLQRPRWGFASAVHPHCKSSNAVSGLYFSGSPPIIFSLWLSRKTHMMPNDPIQSQDLWGAKMALGQGHQRKGAIHLFHGLWLYKRKWSKWQLFITKSQEFKQLPRTIWIGGNTGRYTSPRCSLWFYPQRTDFLRLLAHSSQGTLVL